MAPVVYGSILVVQIQQTGEHWGEEWGVNVITRITGEQGLFPRLLFMFLIDAVLATQETSLPGVPLLSLPEGKVMCHGGVFYNEGAAPSSQKSRRLPGVALPKRAALWIASSMIGCRSRRRSQASGERENRKRTSISHRSRGVTGQCTYLPHASEVHHMRQLGRAMQIGVRIEGRKHPSSRARTYTRIDRAAVASIVVRGGARRADTVPFSPTWATSCYRWRLRETGMAGQLLPERQTVL